MAKQGWIRAKWELEFPKSQAVWKRRSGYILSLAGEDAKARFFWFFFHLWKKEEKQYVLK
ncbi:hypothetical protein CJ263_16375 [Maribacter cobaltidurans]|uniref:Uncharacterized protein n=1 Tax=Maribacter cobaltidurans TaxID=1178778 RepID=A0A223V8C9_9FLAO|nr:hypothetical protein CJ263_16375 [Maribacter cobaltidurans]